MASFDKEERRIQARADEARDEQKDQMWRTQCLPRFAQGALTPEQIDAAKNVFRAGFDAGWESHQAFLMSEFIRDSQKKKVHLA
jgi:hypothetical protein